MKKNLYKLFACSIVLGPLSTFPIQSNAETSTDSSALNSTVLSESLNTTSSVNSLSSTTESSATQDSTVAPILGTTEPSTADSQPSSSSTATLEPEPRIASVDSWMPDPVLQQLVAKTIGKTKDTLTQEDMTKLTSLYIQNSDNAIANLQGLELATNLAYFYMNSNNQITDFSVLTTLPKLTQVYLMGTNVNDENVPNFGTTITRLNLSGTNVTDKVYNKISKMTNLESLAFESNMNITTIEPAIALTKLTELRVQFCGITDFRPINQMPALTQLAAFGQNTGRNDPATAINAKALNYDAGKQTIYIPFSIMPNRMTNYDGYIPPFTTSNSDSQTYFDFNGVQLDSSRLAITDEGITVSGVTQDEFDQLKTFKYNARLNNPAGSYNQPDRFTFYAISSGTYLHQFDVQHTTPSPGVTIKYVDEDGDNIHPPQIYNGNVGEDYDTTTETYQLAIDGYTLDNTKLPENAVGKFTADMQTVIYIYKRNDVTLKAHDSMISVGDPWDPADNFDGGIAPNGENIALSDVSVKGTVNNQTAGKYEITYSYARVPNRSWSGDSATAKATVTVVDPMVTIQYVDQNGKKIHKETVIKGKLDTQFDVSGKDYQPDIKGYALDKKQLPKNAKGTFSAKAQTVTYVYQSTTTPTTSTNDSESTTTAPTASAETSSQTTGEISDSSKKNDMTPVGSSNNPSRRTISNQTTAKKLPKTGERYTPSYLITGISILFLATALLFFSRKKVK